MSQKTALMLQPAGDHYVVNRPLQVSHLGQLCLSSFRGQSMGSRLVYRMYAQVAPSAEYLRGHGRVAVDMTALRRFWQQSPVLGQRCCCSGLRGSLLCSSCGLSAVKINENYYYYYYSNFNKHQPILVIFGRDVAERVCYQMVNFISPLLTNVSALPGETWTPKIVFFQSCCIPCLENKKARELHTVLNNMALLSTKNY